MSIGPSSLSKPIQIAGHRSVTTLVVMLVGLSGVIAGLMLVAHDKLIAAIVAGISLIVFVIAVTIILRRRKQQAWIQVSENGFVYRDRMGESSYSDDDVVGLNLISKSNYRQGQLKSHTNEIELKVADRAIPIKMVHTTELEYVDPLAPFVQRTIENYRERAESALHEGARLGGDGWLLGRDDVDVGGPDNVRLAIRDLVAMETIDAHHLVWKKGVDQPILSVPVKSQNAFLLVVLLAPKIEAMRGDQPYDLGEPGLGRQIFRRVTGTFGRWFARSCLLFAVLSIPLCVVAAIVNNATFIAVSIVGVCLALPAAMLGWFLLRNEFRCHERGVFRRKMFSQRELRFEDVASFTYQAIRQYYNGGYMGTSLGLTFDPTPESGKKKLSYSRMVQNADEALDGLRDHISHVLVPKMARELHETGWVQWMPNVRISKDGFHYRPQAFVGRKKEIFLPFAEVTGFDLDEGTFHIWQRGVKKSVIHETSAVANFFPGYYLLLMMYSTGQQRSEQDGDVQDGDETQI